MRFRGKVAAVTGAARGIGKEIARALADEGAYVWLLDRRSDLVLSAAQEVNGAGGRARAFTMDHSQSKDVTAAIEAIVSEHGRLDVGIANAGRAAFHSFLEISAEDWRAAIETNLTGTFLFAQQCARAMLTTGGAIVLVSSVSALEPTRQFAHYAAAKAGVVALGRVMAKELGQFGVRTNILCPGYIGTEATHALQARSATARVIAAEHPLGRWGTASEVASAALFLCSEAASFVNGTVLTVSGGTMSLDLAVVRETE